MLRRTFFGLLISLLSYLGLTKQTKPTVYFEILALDAEDLGHDFWNIIVLLVPVDGFSGKVVESEKRFAYFNGVPRFEIYNTPWLRYAQEGNLVTEEEIVTTYGFQVV